MSDLVLPDSRLRSDKGSVVSDWENPNGTIVRIECVPVFCANCGKQGPYVPKENTTFAFYLCMKCAETHGEIAGIMMVPDEVFFKKAEEAILEKFGRLLGIVDLLKLAERGWGPLASLVKESPFKGRS